MKFACLVGFLFSFIVPLHAQDITGIWRGYFYSGYGIYRQEFKYEVQINQLDSKRGPGSANAIKGVTYSYRQTSFYGKARFVGIYSKDAKELTLKEDTLLEVKMDALSFSCLMTCYLTYSKTADREILQGTFSSITTVKGNDCGSGTVYLERVTESDFHKEDFLLKTKPPRGMHINEAPVRKLKPDTQAVVKRNPPPQKVTPPPAKDKPVVKQTPPPTPNKKPSTNNNNTAKKPAIPEPPVVTKTDTVVKTTPVEPPVVINPPIVKRPLPPVPDVIKQRENPLVKTITTNSPDIQIELYDNGEVDGDTITVYHNNEVIALRKGLTTKPITINVKATPEDNHHEFIMVANNLGAIPPNTALMVVRTGGKRYELFISSNEEKNAKVVINYEQNSTSTP